MIIVALVLMPCNQVEDFSDKQHVNWITKVLLEGSGFQPVLCLPLQHILNVLSTMDFCCCTTKPWPCSTLVISLDGHLTWLRWTPSLALTTTHFITSFSRTISTRTPSHLCSPVTFLTSAVVRKIWEFSTTTKMTLGLFYKWEVRIGFILVIIDHDLLTPRNFRTTITDSVCQHRSRTVYLLESKINADRLV